MLLSAVVGCRCRLSLLVVLPLLVDVLVVVDGCRYWLSLSVVVVVTVVVVVIVVVVVVVVVVCVCCSWLLLVIVDGCLLSVAVGCRC